MATVENRVRLAPNHKKSKNIESALYVCVFRCTGRYGQPNNARGTAMIDSTDKRILELLQEDSTTPLVKMAEMVNLSTTPCWRRIQRMEGDGVIIGHMAVLNPAKLNLSLTALVEIKAAQHTTAWLATFQKAISEIPEIVEAYRMSGHIDYLLKIMVPDISSYDHVYKRLISKVDLDDVSSSFAMEVLKRAGALPLNYAS
jgi:Lrp/AsnC family transcriptional regulator